MPVTDFDLLDNMVHGNEIVQVVESVSLLELVVNKNGPKPAAQLRTGNCNTSLWRTQGGQLFGLTANA